jgi:hypothetical protein
VPFFTMIMQTRLEECQEFHTKKKKTSLLWSHLFLSYKWKKLGHIKGIWSFLYIRTPYTVSNRAIETRSASTIMVPDLKNEYQQQSESRSKVKGNRLLKKVEWYNISMRTKTDTISQSSTPILLQLIPLFEEERWKASPPSIHGWWFILFG